jgi:hypothetical protein
MAVFPAVFLGLDERATQPENCVIYQGRIQDFKLGGALKKIAPSRGRRENFGVFRVFLADNFKTNAPD